MNRSRNTYYKIELWYFHLELWYFHLDFHWDPDHSNISAQTGKLKDLATRYQFEQLIKGHTRITDNTATLLDLAFTNKPENIVGAEIEHVGISDHSLIYIQRKISISRSGIPQGSNLGPLLFLLYINDLPNCLKYTKANMFADDTNLTTASLNKQELQRRLNSDLELMHNWLLANKLTLNKEKTEYMLIGSHQRLSTVETDPILEFGDTKIKRVNHAKSLGIIIDEQLLWKNQIEAISSKVSKGIGVLRRIKNCVPKTTLIKVYNALVLPYFDYCSLVWSNCSDQLIMISKLQKMQNRAARVITGRSYETPSSDVLRELDWKPLIDHWEKNSLVFMYKAKRNELPENLMDLFEIKNNINYNLRSNGNEFTLQKPKTNFMKKSISYNGAKTWNNLPRCVKTSDATIRQFKAALDRIKH